MAFRSRQLLLGKCFFLKKTMNFLVFQQCKSSVIIFFKKRLNFLVHQRSKVTMSSMHAYVSTVWSRFGCVSTLHFCHGCTIFFLPHLSSSGHIRLPHILLQSCKMQLIRIGGRYRLGGKVDCNSARMYEPTLLRCILISLDEQIKYTTHATFCQMEMSLLNSSQ